VERESQLKAGSLLGPYELQKLLGKGAYAEVWLATERGALGFEKKTALKVLHGGSKEGDPHFASLVNEARVCGHLHHPHIVDVYGVGQEGDLWFIAMEFVDGVTLDDLLEQVREADLVLPKSIILDIGIQVAQALDHAHRAKGETGEALQIVHRDLKPANIMVARRGGVKVADFGIAKATTNVETTSTGLLKGTPCYVAPEVWEGTRDFHPRVDLFAVGAILWELTMRRRLYSGDSIAALAGRIVLGSADEEAAELEETFPELGPVVRRLIERKPADRMQRASRLVSDLRSVRRPLDAPGDLDFFFELLELAQTSREKRLERMIDLAIPPTDEPGWSRVIKIVSGEQPTLPKSAPLDERALPKSISRTKTLPPESVLPTEAVVVPGAVAGQRHPGGDDPTRQVAAERAKAAASRGTVPSPAVETPRPDVPASHSHPKGTESIRVEFIGEPERPSFRRAPVAAGALLLGLVVLVVTLVATDGPPDVISNEAPEVEPALAESAPEREGLAGEASTAAEDGEAVPDLELSLADTSGPAVARVEAQAEPAPSLERGQTAEEPEEVAQTTHAPAPVEPAPAEAEAQAEAAPVLEEPGTVEAAVLPDGCIVFQSNPGGATIWLDGVELASSAKPRTSSLPFVKTLPEGEHVVEMGFQGERATRIDGVQTRPGVRVVVNCDLANRLTCKITETNGCP